jgi:hypothetical protein
MPRQAKKKSSSCYSKKDSYSSSCSSSSSSSSCPSSSSSSSSSSCAPPAPVRKPSKKDKCCQPDDCVEYIEAETDVFPEVTCDQVCSREGKFNVGVCVEAKPRCCIREIKSKQISPCKFECTYEIGVGVDYTAKATPFNGCSLDAAKFKLDVKNRFETRCSKKDKKSKK